MVSSAFITKVIGALFKIPLANILGGVGMSYFSAAYAIFLPVYAIAVIGLSTAVSRTIAENIAFERYKNVKKIKRIAVLSFGILGLFFSLLIVLTAKPFSLYIIQNEKALPALYAMAPCIFFGSVMSCYRGYFEGRHNMTPTALSQVLEAVAKLVCGLLFAILTLNYCNDKFLANEKIFGVFCEDEVAFAQASLPYIAAAAVLGITASSLIACLFMIFRDFIDKNKFSREMLLKDKSTDSTKDIFKSLLFLVIPVAIGSLVTNLTSLIDLATITRFLNNSIKSSPEFFTNKYEKVLNSQISLEVLPDFIYGSFTGLAVTVFNLIPSVMGMFGKGVIPKLAENYALNDKKNLEKNVQNIIFLTSIVAIPSGVGVAFLSKPILLFLFPERIAEVEVIAQSMIFLGVSIIFLSLTIPIFSMFQAIGRADFPVKIMLVGIAIKLLGNVIFLPINRLNVSGAAISTGICYMIILVVSLYYLKKITNVRYNYSFLFIKPAFASIFCGLTAHLSYTFLLNKASNLVVLPLSIIVGFIFYVILLYLLGEIEKNALKSMFF